MHVGCGQYDTGRESSAGNADCIEQRSDLHWRNGNAIDAGSCWCDLRVDRSERLHFNVAESDGRRRRHVSRVDHSQRLHVSCGQHDARRQHNAVDADCIEQRSDLLGRNGDVVDACSCRRDVFVDWPERLHLFISESFCD